MREKVSTKFLVNKKPIELNPFVNDFLAQVTIGAVKSLKGVDYIKKVEMHREHDDVTVNVNGEEIPITPFPNGIISSTIIGLASTLKGVDNVETFSINVDVG
jgi:hypothetical protein